MLGKALESVFFFVSLSTHDFASCDGNKTEHLAVGSDYLHFLKVKWSSCTVYL